MSDRVRMSAEVADALRARRPVVAFESTIISHGMPYPRNVETALEAERIARDAGVAPATIALLDGRIVVGLDRAELERLARECGFAVARLETGLRQPNAIRFYETSGYRRIEPFGRHRGDPLSVCFEKAL